MKVLLTGSTGQLGYEIINSKPNDIELYHPTRMELDLLDYKSCERFILEKRPEWIINTAAYTLVDQAEIERDKAKNINSFAPLAFTKAINKIDCNLLHLSTDYVFNGKQNKPYQEKQATCPINYYGYTKALSEALIEKEISDKSKVTILRTSWVISPRGRNFVKTILNAHKEKENINVVSDQVGVPTSAKELAKVCWKIIELKKSKKLPFIIHWSDSGISSRYNLALEVGNLGLELGLLKKQANLNAVSSQEYKTDAKRPKYSLLSIDKTIKLLNIKPKNWKENLKEILIDYKKINK